MIPLPVTLLAVGDVSPRHSDDGRNLEAVRDLLRGGDITFGQLEEPLSNRGDRQLYAGLGGPLWDGPPFDPGAGAALLRDHGFDLMSFAGNHTMDRSEESMFDTIGAAGKAGIAAVTRKQPSSGRVRALPGPPWLRSPSRRSLGPTASALERTPRTKEGDEEVLSKQKAYLSG